MRSLDRRDPHLELRGRTDFRLHRGRGGGAVDRRSDPGRPPGGRGHHPRAAARRPAHPAVRDPAPPQGRQSGRHLGHRLADLQCRTPGDRRRRHQTRHQRTQAGRAGPRHPQRDHPHHRRSGPPWPRPRRPSCGSWAAGWATRWVRCGFSSQTRRPLRCVGFWHREGTAPGVRGAQRPAPIGARPADFPAAVWSADLAVVVRGRPGRRRRRAGVDLNSRVLIPVASRGGVRGLIELLGRPAARPESETSEWLRYHRLAGRPVHREMPGQREAARQRAVAAA